MLKRLLTIVFAVVAIAGLAGSAHAQYMFLDSNGDGVNTAADVLNANGTPTTVDAYLYTNQNADGSTATCDTGDGELTINSYVVNTVASGGTVTYSNFVNQVASFTIIARPFTTDATQMTVAQASGTPLAPGFYHLCTFTVTGDTGTPSLSIVDFTTIGPDQCSFGSACSGFDFLNTYALNTDWFDTGNLGAAVATNSPPSITAPATASGAEGTPIATITATATDPDAADILTISQTGMPADLTFTTTPAVSPNSATITGTPGPTDAGTYNITWTVDDGHAHTATAPTTLTIANTDRPPVLAAISDISVAENATASTAVSATDPDGDTINLTASLPAFATLNAPLSGAGSVSTTVSAAPGFNDAGSYPSSVTATSLLLSATQNFTINVINTDRPPVLAAISDINVAEGATASTAVSASDPDGDLINLTASLPGFATLDAPTSGTGSVSTTVTASPGFSDSGSYPSSVTATSLLLSATQNFTINVSNTDRPPVLAAISDINVAEGATASTAVSATDPDGDTINLTASLPGFATLNAPLSGAGSVSTT
ncbi:MAG: Ig-like domain-containing protein, partial [Hyphomicrobiales bacterium]